MSDKADVIKKAKLFIELAELHRKQFDSRRQVEWKINFAFWGALGLVVYHYGSRASGLSSCEWALIALGIVFASLFYAVGHLPAIFGTQEKDIHFMIYYKDLAAELRVGGDAQKEPCPISDAKRMCSWCYAWKHGKCWYLLALMLVSLGVAAAGILLLLCRVEHLLPQLLQ